MYFLLSFINTIKFCLFAYFTSSIVWDCSFCCIQCDFSWCHFYFRYFWWDNVFTVFQCLSVCLFVSRITKKTYRSFLVKFRELLDYGSEKSWWNFESYPKRILYIVDILFTGRSTIHSKWRCCKISSKITALLLLSFSNCK